MSITFTSLSHCDENPSSEIFLAEASSNSGDVSLVHKKYGFYKPACLCCGASIKFPAYLVLKERRPDLEDLHLHVHVHEDGSSFSSDGDLIAPRQFAPIAGGEIEAFLLAEDARRQAKYREEEICELLNKVRMSLPREFDWERDIGIRREVLTRLLQER